MHALLNIETFTDTVPTIGFSKFVTKHKGMSINIFDLGGSARIREIWQNYFAEVFYCFLLFKYFENLPSNFLYHGLIGSWCCLCC